MASWLKPAEDLFEVVDRRAKLAVGDKPDEQLNLQTPASNGRGSQPKRTRPKAKPKKLLSSDETTVQTVPETSKTEATFDKDTAVPLAENSGISPHSFTRITINEDQHIAGGVGSIAETPSPGIILNEDLKNDAGHIEAAATRQIEALASNGGKEKH